MEKILSSIITKSYAIKNRVFPLEINEEHITVQMTYFNVSLINELKSLSGRDIKIVKTAESEIISNIYKFYNDSSEKDSMYETMVENIIDKAIFENASDIHIEPFEDYFRVRYRIHGSLKTISKQPIEEYNKLKSIIKLKSDCDITEKRIPQDGRFSYKKNKEDLEIRLSTIPTFYGEKLELRLLNRKNFIKSIEELGFSPKAVEMINSIIERKRGMLVVSGPTGSGKSSTVYSILNGIREEEINITTIEDPVECRIEGINQIQINPKAGIRFDNGLRAILRQDPDCIVVGEIRDFETAQIAIRAAMTGHFVITTIHTEDALSTINRLKDIGILTYQINSAISGIISQKLVRKNTIVKEYKGDERVLLYEVVKLDEVVKNIIKNNDNTIDMKNKELIKRMITFQESVEYLQKQK